MAKPKAVRKLRERPRWFTAIFYGTPGSGKTGFLGTAERLLLLNADGPDGPEYIRSQGGDPDVWDIESYNDLDKAFRWLREDELPYDLVALDSATLFQEKGMDQIMVELVQKAPHRNLWIPDRPEYLLNQNRFSNWVRSMRGLPYNFAMTAHEMRVEDEDDGDVLYLPAIHGGKGALASKMCGYVSIVGRLHVVTKKGEDEERDVRVLSTKRTGKFYGKDRFDVTGGRVVNPTIPKLLSAIAGPGARRRPARKKTTTRRRRTT